MKRIKAFAFVLAMLHLVVLLCACGTAGNSEGFDEGFGEAKGKTLDEVLADIKDRGAVGAVVSVYEEKKADGAVFVSGNYKSAAKGDCVTVAVNDLSMKDVLAASPEAPRFISAESYNAVVSVMDETDAKKLDAFYNDVNGVMFLTPDASAKELRDLYSVFEKYEFSCDKIFEEYVSLGFVPTLASPIEATVLTKDNCSYGETEDGVVIKGLKENFSNIVIPDEIDSKPVVGVELEAFFTYPEFLYSVTLGKNVESVDSLGKNTSGLYNINGNESCAFFGNTIFSDYTVTDEKGFETLSCVLLSYEGTDANAKIPENINYISAGAFRECKSVKSVTLHEEVYSVSREAFYGCSALEECILPKNNTRLADYAFWGCEALSDIDLPENITEIADGLFYGCSALSEIDLPEGLREIGSSAFANCTGFRSIKIPSSVTAIGDSAIYGCTLLDKIYVEDVDAYCRIEFYGNSFATVPTTLYLKDEPVSDLIIPDGVTSVSSGSFANIVSLKSVTVPASVETICEKAFENCTKLQKISGCVNVKEIESSAFAGCIGLKDFDGGEKVVSVGGNAFEGTAWLQDKGKSSKDGFVMMGDGILVSYEGSATEVVLPENVKSICATAFSSAEHMTSLTINGTVTSMEFLRFGDGLEKLVIPATVTDILELRVPYHQEPGDFDPDVEYVEGTTIYCTAGSAAEEYAITWGIPYEIID